MLFIKHISWHNELAKIVRNIVQVIQIVRNIVQVIQIVRDIVNCDSMVFYLNHPFSEMLTQSLSLIHTGYLAGSLTLVLVETFDCSDDTDDELVTDEAWITAE